MNGSSNETILESSEMGYLLLKNCSLTLSVLDQSSIPLQTWTNVNILSDADLQDADTTTTTAPNGTGEEPAPCSHCNIVLHGLKEKNMDDDAKVELSLSSTNAPRFQGTMADMAHHQHHQIAEHNDHEDDPTSPENRQCQQKRRSDAALLMGCIIDAQDHGYVTIKKLQVLFHDGDNQFVDSDDDSSAARKASLLVTLAFPSLESPCVDPDTAAGSKRRTQQPTSQLRSIVPGSKSTSIAIRASSNVKPLPPSVQLLLSVIRSDWARLDVIMKQLASGDAIVHGPSQAEQKAGMTESTFFPSKLSLEELYTRIRGSSSRVAVPAPGASREGESADNGTKEQQPMLNLLNLPLEILKTQLAPFLRAKSLDALRCTCKSMHQNLVAVIPGLKLRLYQHQINSLQWMRQRENHALSEAKGAKLMQSCNTSSAGNANSTLEFDNDLIRAMTGGQSVWLCPRGKATAVGMRLDQLTGNEIDEQATDGLVREGARGGFLCDEPGLGKTITILSLLLQTMGVSTEPQNWDPKVPIKEMDLDRNLNPEEEIFRAYWKEQIPVEFRRPALCRLMTKLTKLDPCCGLFLRPIDPERDDCEDYLNIIEKPMCINDIFKRISNDQYGAGNSDFGAFVFDVELCFRNAMEYNPVGHEIHDVARTLLDRFQLELLVQFKQEQLGSLRSSASNTTLKPDSSVALLLRQKYVQEFQQSLIQSTSTLLVIPSVLIEHWEEQIKTHVDFGYCTPGQIPLIYEYTPNRKSALGLEEALRRCRVENTHFPAIFIDKGGTHKLPSPEFLAMFRIVITTTKRFTNEWKNGSFQEEINRKQTENDGTVRDGNFINYRLMEYGSADDEACPLLKINWLRMIVDEGHSMGRGKANSAIRFAAWITSERRWIMSGTPTQQSVSQNGLSNMNNLMTYLQHDFFTPRKGGDKLWKKLIAKSWKDGHLAAFFRLKSLLSLLMTRHTKTDIEELPLPIYATSFVPMSPLEVTTYNTLVCAVQQNLKLTSMKGSKTSGEQDSLLNRSQAKHALLALTNVRRVCCGGTRVVPNIEQRHYVEFVDLCRNQHMLPDSTVRDLEHYLARATTEELSRCFCCGMLLSTLLTMPCGCLLCTECFDGSNVCVTCNTTFDVDEFQLFQPGLTFEWLNTENNDQESKETNAHQLDENNAIAANAATMGNGIDGERGNNNVEGADRIVPVDAAQDGLLLRPPNERRRTRKNGDGHVCEYSRSFEPGKCTLCFEMHAHCKLVNQHSCCQICFLRTWDCPKQESKSYYLVDKLLQLYEKDQRKMRDFTPLVALNQLAGGGGLATRRRLKVIVFSQFRASLNLVGHRLLRRFGTACVAEYWGAYRSAELHKFIHDPDCFIMLLGKDGSEGLDLSFVTHIFFLEAIWDKSLEQQAVARAWRMGATESVQVETLLARNSVEEQMHKLEASLDTPMKGDSTMICDDVKVDKKVLSASEKQDGAEFQRAKVHFFLDTIRLIPEVELVPLAAPEEVEKRFGSQRMITEQDFSATQPVAEPLPKKRRTLPRRVHFAEA